MRYPDFPDYNNLADLIKWHAELKAERGANGISPVLKRVRICMNEAIRKLNKLPDNKSIEENAPNEYKKIIRLRPSGPRKIWKNLPRDLYMKKLEGALLGRMAGCALGAPVEFWPIEEMRNLAKENNQPFPPDDYWNYIPAPYAKRYRTSTNQEYTREKMKEMPVDDDIAYTILGLIIAEQCGLDFTTDDVAKIWLKYVPFACTAEAVVLNNIRKGIPANKAANKNNPHSNWIGGFIRSDPWGYIAPGWPEKAAELAYRDAYLTHRQQGIYGTMFFAAAISASFAANEPVEALRIALTEIPKNCAFARAVRWALKISPEIKNYCDVRSAVENKFTKGELKTEYKGMHPAHTINNACLVILGITIGGLNFTKVISQTVAMGLYNDCTAATAGSIVGASIGKAEIPEHWSRNFDNTVRSYLNGKKVFRITNLLKRFACQAAKIYQNE